MTKSEHLPKVSVFMTVYQQEKYVAESIESVLSQDYPNMELVIGDDGSTDGTQELLLEYQKKHGERIRLILAKENAGITANCNKVLNECSGEYIAFQAGDDIWLPGKITTQVEYLQSHPECSIHYHNLNVFDDETGASLGYFNGPHNPPRSGKADVLIRHGSFNGAIANMVRRSCCPIHGFDNRIPIASDWLFWIEILLNGGEIHYTDQVLARYRLRKNSASNTRSPKILDNFTDHLNSLNILLIKKPVYYQDIFFRMFEIYNILSEFDPQNKAVYKSLYYSRKFFFAATQFRKIIGFKA